MDCLFFPLKEKISISKYAQLKKACYLRFYGLVTYGFMGLLLTVYIFVFAYNTLFFVSLTLQYIQYIQRQVPSSKWGACHAFEARPIKKICSVSTKR